MIVLCVICFGVTVFSDATRRVAIFIFFFQQTLFQVGLHLNFELMFFFLRILAMIKVGGSIDAKIILK